jgi:hypothetical protein
MPRLSFITDQPNHEAARELSCEREKHVQSVYCGRDGFLKEQLLDPTLVVVHDKHQTG